LNRQVATQIVLTVVSLCLIGYAVYLMLRFFRLV
jgi:hypothetical protein